MKSIEQVASVTLTINRILLFLKSLWYFTTSISISLITVCNQYFQEQVQQHYFPVFLPCQDKSNIEHLYNTQILCFPISTLKMDCEVMSDSSKRRSAAVFCECHRSSHFTHTANSSLLCLHQQSNRAPLITDSQTGGTVTARFSDEWVSAKLASCSILTRVCVFIYTVQFVCRRSKATAGSGRL